MNQAATNASLNCTAPSSIMKMVAFFSCVGQCVSLKALLTANFITVNVRYNNGTGHGANCHYIELLLNRYNDNCLNLSLYRMLAITPRVFSRLTSKTVQTALISINNTYKHTAGAA